MRFDEHSSVEESRRLQSEPISLDTCLKAFTKEEELGEDELYFCSKCKEHQPASKTLEIWKLPPILIIHLKRFQFHNGRWVKSHKIVEFPRRTSNFSHYVAERTPPTNANEAESKTEVGLSRNAPDKMNGAVVHEGHQEVGHGTDLGLREATPVGCEAHEDDDYSADIAQSEELTDYSNVQYNLYAMSSHSGILGGGHYVTYAKHPNGKWYIYNDSSCKQIAEHQVDTHSAYILFYERSGLDYTRFTPDISEREADTQEIDDEIESDFKKMCLIQ